jgi:hypothetical protein
MVQLQPLKEPHPLTVEEREDLRDALFRARLHLNKEFAKLQVFEDFVKEAQNLLDGKLNPKFGSAHWQAGVLVKALRVLTPQKGG